MKKEKRRKWYAALISSLSALGGVHGSAATLSDPAYCHSLPDPPLLALSREGLSSPASESLRTDPSSLLRRCSADLGPTGDEGELSKSFLRTSSMFLEMTKSPTSKLPEWVRKLSKLSLDPP